MTPPTTDTALCQRDEPHAECVSVNHYVGGPWRCLLADGVTPPTTDTEPAERFQIDRRRRWMVSEFIPDAGDGCPSTQFRNPTDEEWASLAAERASGGLVGCYHGEPHRCSRCGYEYPELATPQPGEDR